MPVLSKNQVAVKIQQNWLEKNPDDMAASNDGSRTVDDSLTSLNWLHNLNIMGEISASTPPTPPASPGPLSGMISSGGSSCGYTGLHGSPDLRCGTGVSDAKNMSTDCLTSLNTSLSSLSSSICSSSSSASSSSSSLSSTSVTGIGRKNRSGVNSQLDNIDYKLNGDVKPPYSYATLICMAMKANKNKMSLSAIYKWIRDNFMYYRKADAGWQVSMKFISI